MPDAVNLTDSAKKHMERLIDKEGKPIVRLSMKGGGCAGFQYDWKMTDSKEFDDEIIKLSNGEFVIDSQSLLYLIGTKIDYVEEVFGSYLQITNPNSSSSCGCGESVGF
jgi:iron-sulfur cluster insertion protein